MAKTASKPAANPAPPVLKKAGKVPEGYDEKVGGQWVFWNPELPGSVLQGTVAGIVKIKNQKGDARDRISVLHSPRPGDAAELLILPDHFDLMQKLTGVEAGDRLHLEYLGREVVEGVPQPMARYLVAVKKRAT